MDKKTRVTRSGKIISRSKNVSNDGKKISRTRSVTSADGSGTKVRSKIVSRSADGSRIKYKDKSVHDSTGKKVSGKAVLKRRSAKNNGSGTVTKRTVRTSTNPSGQVSRTMDKKTRTMGRKKK